MVYTVYILPISQILDLEDDESYCGIDILGSFEIFFYLHIYPNHCPNEVFWLFYFLS